VKLRERLIRPAGAAAPRPAPPPAATAMARAVGGASRGALLALASLFSASLAPTALAAAAPAQRVHDLGLPDRPVPGALARLRLADDPQQIYYVYVPRLVAPGAPLVVSVHGISRNAEEHGRRFAPFAERYGVVLVAPLFDEARFPDYQRLGRESGAKGKRGARADRMLERIVAEVGRTTPADPSRLFLFGFSGGGQFVHRFAMAYPERVASYVVGAAGWYTFPDATVPFPRGTRMRACLSDVCFDPKRYLRVPSLVLVGERDVHEGSAMRQTSKVNDQQGESRLERGEHWVAAMQAAAQEHGYSTRFGFATLARSGHSFRRAARRGRLGEQVFAWFFGAEPRPRLAMLGSTQ
jgi:poly(3-hydroxybutyrate) depolymerase